MGINSNIKLSHSDLESFSFRSTGPVYRRKVRNYVAFQRSSFVSDVPYVKHLEEEIYLRLI